MFLPLKKFAVNTITITIISAYKSLLNLIDCVEYYDQRIIDNIIEDDSEEYDDQEDQEDNSEEISISEQSNSMKLQSPSHTEATKAAEILMNYIISENYWN